MALPKKNSRKRRNTSSETGLPRKKYCRKKKKNISPEETTTTMTTVHVPDEVIVEIFSKLPVKSLLQLRRLCKYWFKVITDPYFVKMHLNNAHATNIPLVLIASVRQQLHRSLTMEFHYLNSMDDDEVLHPVHIKAPIPFASLPVMSQILGSCNGLLCIGCSIITGLNMIFIWNPCTNQYKRIIWGDDSVKIPIGYEEGTICYGFGYDCRIDDYKVIRNVFHYNGDETLVDKYTLGTSLSKKLGNNRFSLACTSGLFVNGDLYWQARLKGSGPFDIIVAFNIVKEEYRQIAKPPYITHDDQSRYSTSLGKLKGCLCVLTYTKQSAEFWVMKHSIVEDMNKEYSWDILFTTSALPIGRRIYLKPLMFCKHGEIAMVKNRREFILYNPKDNKIRCLLKARGGMEVSGVMEVETYIESLVPVNGGTYIGGRSSIATDKTKRKLKRPLRFLDEYK